MPKWKYCDRWCNSKWKRRAASVPGRTKNHNGLILPLTRLTKANVPGNSNRPLHVFFFFPTFSRISQRKSVDSAGKSAFSKIVKFESDLLTTNKDIAPQSHQILEMFVRWEGGTNLPPHHTNVCKFLPLCRTISSFAWDVSLTNWASFLIIRRSFQCPRIFSLTGPWKVEKPWKGLFPEVSAC